MNYINNTFKGIDIFDMEFMRGLELQCQEYDRINLHTIEETLQIRITLDYLKSPNHPLRQALSLHPEKELYVSTTALEKEYYDVHDALVRDYVLFISKRNPNVHFDANYINPDTSPSKSAKL